MPIEISLPALERPSPERQTAEEKAKEILGLAEASLLATYPVLREQPFRDRLVSPSRLIVKPFDEVEALEVEKVAAKKTFLYPLLRSIGIPAEEVDDMYHTVTADSPSFTFTEDGKTFMVISREFINSLSGSSEVATMNAISLGMQAIDYSIKLAPNTRTLLQQAEWKEIMRTGLRKFLTQIEEGGYDSKWITRVEEKMSEKINNNSFVKVRGAGVSIHFPDVSETNPELVIGNVFNLGIIKHLARNARINFSNASAQILGPNRNFFTRRTKFEDYSKLILADMQDEWLSQRDETQTAFDSAGEMLSDHKDDEEKKKGKKKKDATEIDKQKLMEAYVYSLIPVFYHASSRPEERSRINPWIYPN